jgi:hypothetical protein
MNLTDILLNIIDQIMDLRSELCYRIIRGNGQKQR